MSYNFQNRKQILTLRGVYETRGEWCYYSNTVHLDFFGSSFPAAAHVHLYLVLCATCTQGSLVTNESQPGIPLIPGGSPKPHVLHVSSLSGFLESA